MLAYASISVNVRCLVVEEVIDLALLQRGAETRRDMLGELTVRVPAEQLDVVLEHLARVSTYRR